MARINIDDEFWIVLGRVDRGNISFDALAGNALRMLRFAQQQFKYGKPITELQWKMEGFYDCLCPVLAQKCEDGYFIHQAEEWFGWLRDRVEAGRKGGLARNGGEPISQSDKLIKKNARLILKAAVDSGKLVKPDKCEHCDATGRIEAHHENYDKPLDVVWVCSSCHGKQHTIEINNLRIAKNSKNEQPTPSFSFSPSDSLRESKNTGGVESQQELFEDPLKWLIELWNNATQGCFPSVQKIGSKSARHKQVLARLRKHPNPETWAEVFRRMVSSEFLSGRSGVWAGGGFDWVVESDKNFSKVLAGNYNPELKAKPRVDWNHEAVAIHEAVKSSRLRDNQPPERMELMRKAGLTWSKCGQWPDNDFTIKKIAGLLKAASEQP